jgi:hypothetical protein
MQFHINKMKYMAEEKKMKDPFQVDFESTCIFTSLEDIFIQITYCTWHLQES